MSLFPAFDTADAFYGETPAASPELRAKLTAVSASKIFVNARGFAPFDSLCTRAPSTLFGAVFVYGTF